MEKTFISIDEQKRKAAEAVLCALLNEAKASGLSDRSAKDIWAAVEAEYLARHL